MVLLTIYLYKSYKGFSKNPLLILDLDANMPEGDFLKK